MTNRELFNACYATTQIAGERLETLAGDLPALEVALTPAKVKEVRDLLREAYCAAQELKTRLKQRDAAPNGRKNHE